MPYAAKNASVSASLPKKRATSSAITAPSAITMPCETATRTVWRPLGAGTSVGSATATAHDPLAGKAGAEAHHHALQERLDAERHDLARAEQHRVGRALPGRRPLAPAPFVAALEDRRVALLDLGVQALVLAARLG